MNLKIELIRDNIIIPALTEINSYTDDAADMVLVSGAAESLYGDVRQRGGGPALSWWQIEPRTHDDIWRNYLGITRRQHLLDGLQRLSTRPGLSHELEANPWYAAAMCRIFYLRISERLPRAGDRPAQAAYWKKYYNTAAGKGTIGGFLEKVNTCLA